MRKMYKTQKGITLVALVITIIVLIILAAVSINAVMNDGLINNAKTAARKYENAAKNEQTELGKLMDELESAKRTWVLNEETETVTDGQGHTFNIGDTVTYKQNDVTSYTAKKEITGSTEDQTIARKELTWKVVGVNEKGRLELISTETFNPVNIYGFTGAENATNLVDDICNKLYGNEKTNTSSRAYQVENYNGNLNFLHECTGVDFDNGDGIEAPIFSPEVIDCSETNDGMVKAWGNRYYCIYPESDYQVELMRS